MERAATQHTASLMATVFAGNALEWQLALVDMAQMEGKLEEKLFCHLTLLTKKQAETQQ